MNQDQIWSQVQEELRFQLAKRTYDMWLKNTSVVSADGGTFRIGVPSKLAMDWLEDRFSGLIQETLQAVTGAEVRRVSKKVSKPGARPFASALMKCSGRTQFLSAVKARNMLALEKLPWSCAISIPEVK